MPYNIGSFNCLNFTQASSKNVQSFADIILNENFDIVALQEIKGQQALNRILSRLPSYWMGIADNDSNVSDYAFVWNTRRFVLANAEEAGMARIYSPRIYKQYKIDRLHGQKNLVREPFYARFFPTGGSAPYIEIRIFNTHIRYSKGKEEAGQEVQTLGSILMRKNEFDVLTKAIYAKESDKRYGNNRPAYTILLGDYNLNMRSSSATDPYLLDSFEIIDGRSTKKIKTVQDQLTTLKKPNEENRDKSKNIFSSNYDHFTFDANRFNDISVTCDRINTVKKYCDDDYEQHLKDISDHIPVVMKLNIRR